MAGFEDISWKLAFYIIIKTFVLGSLQIFLLAVLIAAFVNVIGDVESALNIVRTFAALVIYGLSLNYVLGKRIGKYKVLLIDDITQFREPLNMMHCCGIVLNLSLFTLLMMLPFLLLVLVPAFIIAARLPFDLDLDLLFTISIVVACIIAASWSLRRISRKGFWGVGGSNFTKLYLKATQGN